MTIVAVFIWFFSRGHGQCLLDGFPQLNLALGRRLAPGSRLHLHLHLHLRLQLHLRILRPRQRAGPKPNFGHKIIAQRRQSRLLRNRLRRPTGFWTFVSLFCGWRSAAVPGEAAGTQPETLSRSAKKLAHFNGSLSDYRPDNALMTCECEHRFSREEGPYVRKAACTPTKGSKILKAESLILDEKNPSQSHNLHFDRFYWSFLNGPEFQMEKTPR